MSPKESGEAKSGSSSLVTPGRVGVAVVVVLVLILIFENTRHVEIRLIIPEVTMPLWLALLGMFVIGGLVGAYVARRRR
ncbi:DUF1049 domain-containing protein [Streptomyces sp. NPDC060194]|uniref:DUF1049 domain-containing protein n=1 Tax=Streptomyces sp. NPDC060194 TaxID=3347069 RepID=UPI0036581AF7